MPEAKGFNNKMLLVEEASVSVGANATICCRQRWVNNKQILDTISTTLDLSNIYIKLLKIAVLTSTVSISLYHLAEL